MVAGEDICFIVTWYSEQKLTPGEGAGPHKGREAGERVVPDYEVPLLAEALGLEPAALLTP